MSVVNAIPLLLGDEGYNISRSVRLRSSASAYFNRTPGSAGTRTTWTMSMWVKRGALGTAGLFSTINSATVNTTCGFNGDVLDLLEYQGSTVARLVTTQVFRDPSAWYHIVIAWDTTQATSSNRIKIYVNGSQVTSFSTATYPSLNLTSIWNNNVSSSIGTYNNGSPPQLYFDGYLTEVNFIDGQALTPSSFGETDTTTGVWKPKKYAGTYGTNGFYLNFSDNSNNTATTIGKDYSGNGNNWTPNNISVTAGVTYDSMIDVPTLYADGGNGRGNYCTWNPLSARTTTLTNGNLAASTTTGMCAGTVAVSSGKWYWECTPTDTSAQQLFGIIAASNTSFPTYPGQTSDSYGYYAFNGNKYTNSTATSYGAAYGNNDVIGVALDLDAGTLVFYKNGTSQGTAYSSLSGTFLPAAGDGATNAWVGNFGQRPFAYTPPTGFKALNTQNLPAPTILKGNKYFDATTYTGNGSTQSIVNAGGFQPDLVWMKTRSLAYSHGLYDSVRGVNLALRSDSTNAEQVYSSSSLTAFNSNGFTVGSYADVNPSGGAMVGWQWKANGSAVTNTSGSITSQVNAGTSQGFSVVTYTGTGANATVGHGLGVAPKMIIVKNRSAGSTSWIVYHQNAAASPATGGVRLDLTAAFVTYSLYWNNTAPTSSVFTVGAENQVNGSGNSMVAYCFSEVAGFSKFGSYTGNGSTDGPFVFCGFRPRFVMTKRTDSASQWYVIDTARDLYNSTANILSPNSSGAESSNTAQYDELSNGFKLRTTNGDNNASGGTYIFMAFAESPFKHSLAR